MVLLLLFVQLLLLPKVTATAVSTSSFNTNINDHENDFSVNWKNITVISKTMATLQVVNNPVLNKKLSPIADQLFDNLHNLQADLVRYVPWFPYPIAGVAELEPPNATDQTTSWNFPEELQQPFLDTFNAVTATTTTTSNTDPATQQQQKRVVINFSTQPTWMFNTTDWSYKTNNPAGECDWRYPRGAWIPETTQLVADYYGRLASWIVLGHFTDEFGTKVEGGPALGDRVTHWEIFNEPEAEHRLTWREYVRLYDAIVRAIRIAVDPHHRIEFFGMSLEGHDEWDWWEGFLNLENHAPDAQDAVANGYSSFHWYGQAGSRTNTSQFMATFDQMHDFLDELDHILAIRDRLSPTTKLAVNEAGVIPPDDNTPGSEPSPPIYYNMVAAVYSVLFAELSLKGVDVVGSSQYCGCPQIPLWNITNPQFPGVSMTNWTTGAGNPRYWALKLFLQNFGPGDRIVSTSSTSNMMYLQGRITKDRNHLLMVINKSDQQQTLTSEHLVGGHVSVVDESTHDEQWKEFTLQSTSLLLDPFAVAVVDVTTMQEPFVAVQG